MKKTMNLVAIIFALCTASFAQKKDNEKEEEKGKSRESISVPSVVKSALSKKYPDATKVTWEKEKGNYEANWGGKLGEDNSVQFTPKGYFVEIVNAIPVSQLPASAIAYLKKHYKSNKISEAGKVTDAKEKLSYEAEVNRKDIIFDENGNFVKGEK